MTCDEAREAFTDLYDGTLSGPPLVALSQHLDGCRPCRLEWTAFREAIQALHDLRDEEPPPGFAARVVEQIRIPPWWRRAVDMLVFPLRVKLPIHAAALVLVGMVGLWMYQRSPELPRAAEVRVPTPVGRAASPPLAAPVPEKMRVESRPQATLPAQLPAPPSKPAAPQDATRAMVEPKTAPPPVSEAPGAAQAPPAVKREASKPLVQPVPSLTGKAEPESVAPRLLRSAPAPQESVKAQSAPQLKPASPATGKKAVGSPGRTADDLFSTAATDFAAQKYDGAIEHFRTFLLQYPKDRRAPDARFLLAEAYRAQHQYARATAEYDAFLGQYPDHRRAPDVLYHLGETRLAMGDPGGCQILRDALNRYPRAREATTAQETLAARCP